MMASLLQGSAFVTGAASGKSSATKQLIFFFLDFFAHHLT
jgi:hypothetical protein